MNYLLHKTTIALTTIAILAIGFFTMASIAEASPVLTGGSQPVLTVSNYTNCYNCSNWTSSTSADAGDEVAFSIWYANTGTSIARDVTLHFSDDFSSASTNHQFSATVSAANASSASRSVSVNLSSAQSMEYVQGSSTLTVFPPNSPVNPSGAGADVFSSGYHVGDIPVGHEGTIVFRMRVDNQSTPQAPDIDVKTLTPNNVSETSALLRGEWEGDFEPARVWFEYANTSSKLSSNGNGSNGGTTTSKQSKGASTGWKSFSDTATGLNAGTTYYYQACAENTNYNIIKCDPHKSFTTDGTVTVDDISIDTRSAQDITDSSAELHGYVANEGNAPVNVWFEWDTSHSDVDNGNGSTLSVSGNYYDGDSFDRVLSGLDDDHRYYYRACGEDIDGYESCGSIYDFETDAGQSLDNEPDVETHSPRSISETSAYLRGEYDMNDFDDGDVFFAYSDDRDDLYGVEDEDRISDVENYAEVTIAERNAHGRDNVEERVTGLRTNTRYYYRTCVLFENNDNDDEIICGSVESFSTDRNVVPTSNPPIAGACSATGVSTTAATVSAYVSGNGNSGTRAYFEYGPTPNLGLRSAEISIGSGERTTTRFLTGLQPNLNYYCRIVAVNSDGTRNGSMGVFRTDALPTSITPPTPNRPTVIVSSGGGDGSPVFLEIDNNQEVTTRGQVVQYTVEWANLTQRDLEQVILHIRLPKAARFNSATQGMYNRRDHTLTYQIGTLEAGEEDDLSIMVRIGGAREGEPVVAEAILAFEDPQQGDDASFNAIEYDNDTYTNNSNGLLAGLFGIGFLPGLIGILLAILILLIIILVARRIMERREEDRSNPYA